MMKRIEALSIGALLTSLVSAGVEASTLYFQVAEWPGREEHFDSYLLPLADPLAIDHARDLIRSGPSVGETIVVARIAAGADGINRNLLAPGAPLWSWQVTEFLGFADVTAELLDGWPGQVEADVADWIQNTDGTIGFWNYTVVAELGPIPVPGTLTLWLVGLVSLLPMAGLQDRYTGLDLPTARKRP